MSLFFKTTKSFTGVNYRWLQRAEYTYEPVLELFAKKFRKMALESTLIEKSKLIIPAVRTRQPNDTLTSMRKDKQCAGVILGREEFPEVDFVMYQRQGFTLRGKRNSKLQKYHVELPETKELIPVILKELQIHPVENWVAWVHFTRYLVGRPNLLYIPIETKVLFNNPYINSGCEFVTKMKGVWVYCYNDDYPAKFFVDPTNITPTRGYKLGDLINTFPDGVVIHPQYKNELHRNILLVDESMESKLQSLSRDEQKKIMKQYGFLGNEDDEDEEEDIEAKMKEKEEKERKKMEARAVKGPLSPVEKLIQPKETEKLKKLQEEKLAAKEEAKKKRTKFISFKKEIMKESVQVKEEFKTGDDKGKKKDGKGDKAEKTE